MDLSSIFLLIGLVALVIIALLAIYAAKKKKQDKPYKIAFIAFFLVILGIVLGNNEWLGYSLIGAGVILAIIDIIRSLKNK